MNSLERKLCFGALALMPGVLVTSGCGTLQEGVPDEPVLQSYTDRTVQDYGEVGNTRAIDQYFRTTGQGIVDVPALEHYLNGLADRLLEQSSAPDLPVRVKVIPTMGYRANISPEGALGMPVGLLLETKYEDTVAFVLGHELGHVLAGHYDEDWVVETQSRAGTILGISYSVSKKFQGSGETQDATEDIEKAARINQAALLVMDQVVMPEFSRQQELEADRIGVDMLISAGYNPAGFTYALEIFSKIEHRRKRTMSDSIREFQEELKAGADDASTEEELGQEVADAVKEFVQNTVALIRDWLERDYPDPKERRELLSEYFARHYERPGMRIAPLNAETYEAVKSRRSIAAMLEKYRLARDAKYLLVDGKLDKAERKARLAISGVGSDEAFPRIVFANVRNAQGRYELERKNYEYALEADKPPLGVFLGLAETYERAREYGRALSILREARREFDTVPHVYPHLVRVNRRIGEKDRAEQLILECRLEHPKLKEQCDPQKNRAG